jgi:uncharacterized surface protein with fasciclin (FAS1) repeats
MFGGCVACCEDGSPPPCCIHPPTFIEEADLFAQPYTGECTDGVPEIETAQSLADYLAAFGGAFCLGHNNGDDAGETNMLWSAKVDGITYTEYDATNTYHGDGLCCDAAAKPGGPFRTSNPVCCTDGSWSGVSATPDGLFQCGYECDPSGESDDIPVCETGPVCNEGQPSTGLVDFANNALCTGLDDHQCPALTITFQCCDPCRPDGPDALCVETSGVFALTDCPTCERKPAVRENPEALELDHFDVCDGGNLPVLASLGLDAWYANHAGMRCVSANQLSQSAHAGQKDAIQPTFSMTAEEIINALCTSDTCPHVPVELTCCDPCVNAGDPQLCKTFDTSIFVEDCCPHHPKLMSPASSLQIEKTASCAFAQLPGVTDGDLHEWYTTNGGATCQSQNNPDTAMNWHASPSFDDAENALCYGGGCPSIDVTFTCCDPCDVENHNCVSTTATFAIYDKNTPTIGGAVDDVESECDGNPEAALAIWLATATCADLEGDVVFSNSAVASINEAPTFVTSDRCQSATTVRFDCEDDCGLTSTAVLSYTVSDTMPPFITTAPEDMVVECDGKGNVADLEAWVKSAGGMMVSDTCQGVCPYTNNQVITHFREQVSMPTTIWGTLEKWETMNSGSYGYQLLERNGIISATLAAAGPFTLFMPTDGAFDNLLHIGLLDDAPLDSLLADSASASALFLDHIAIGDIDITTLEIGDTIPMVGQQETLTLTQKFPAYMFTVTSTNHWTSFVVVNRDGSTITTGDPGITATNGMLYYVSEVIVGGYRHWQAVANTYNPHSNTNGNHPQNDHNDNGCDFILFGASDVTFVGDLNGSPDCMKVAEVVFTAGDGCGNTVSDTATFTVEDTTPPKILKKAKDKQFPYSGAVVDQVRFSAWLLSYGAATGEDLCAADEDLIWSHDHGGDLPDSCDGDDVNGETCECMVDVEFCVTDCTGIPACTTATFSLYEEDPAPVIDPEGTCPGQDLEHPCDPRCPGFDLTWEFDARVAMNHWIDEQACLCAEDCTDVTWRAVNAPQGELCGRSGVVTFVATDATGNFRTRDHTYYFPDIEIIPDFCESQVYGCCPGTKIPQMNAAGTHCPCTSSLYGCCPDMMTSREDSRGNNCFEPVPPPPPANPCLICDKNNKNKPKSLTILYTAGQGVDDNEQGSKAFGDLTATFPNSASVSASGFSTTVTDGQTFTISGSFSAQSTFNVAGKAVSFHTSCSVPLSTFDRFGPFTILAGGQCPLAVPETSCGMWGCCTNTEIPKEDGIGSNCCGTHGCCNDGSSCTSAECSNCMCHTQEFGCCPGSMEQRAGSYGRNCPLECSFTTHGCCDDPAETPKWDAAGSNCLPAEVCVFPTVCTLEIPPQPPNPPPCTTGFGCCTGTAIMKDDVVGSNCPCETFPFGCCPAPHDRHIADDAAGTDCPCGEFGCCGNSDIVKDDINGGNCPCETTEFGCCPGEDFMQVDATGTNCPCGTTDGAPDCPCVEPDFVPCVICDRDNKNRPSSLRMQYQTAGANSNLQGSKAYGDLTGTFPSPATVTISGETYSLVGEEFFTVQGTFGTELTIKVESAGGGDTSFINFHTSCSVPIRTGDQYGPFLIIEGGECGPTTLQCGLEVGNRQAAIIYDPDIVSAEGVEMETILCKDECTGVSKPSTCEIGPGCYNYSPTGCKLDAECAALQCTSFGGDDMQISSTGMPSMYCQYNGGAATEVACPAGTVEMFVVPVQEGPFLVAASPPADCRCCRFETQSVVCNNCGIMTTVECNQHDPNCVNYGAAICKTSGTTCLPEGGAVTTVPPAVEVIDVVTASKPAKCAHMFDACSADRVRFKSIELMWTGNIMADVQDQGKFAKLKPKSRNVDTMNGGSKVIVLGKLEFSTVIQTPTAGDVYIFTADDAGKKFMPPKMSVKVDKGKFVFALNCKKAPLRIGDEFGPFKVIGFETNRRDTTCLSGNVAALEQDAASHQGDSTSSNKAAPSNTDSSSNTGSNSSTISMDTLIVIACVVVASLILIGAIAGAVKLSRSNEPKLLAEFMQNMDNGAHDEEDGRAPQGEGSSGTGPVSEQRTATDLASSSDGDSTESASNNAGFQRAVV